MTGGAIPTTGRRPIHPAWESISRQNPARVAALRVALLVGLTTFSFKGVAGAAGHGVSSVDHRIAMTGSAISTTDRRSATRPSGASAPVDPQGDADEQRLRPLSTP